MSEAVTLCLAALFSLSGMGWLALSLDAHWQQVFFRQEVPTARTSKRLRLLGWTGLLLSAVLCFVANRPSMAVLVWIMLLAASAALMAQLLAWRAPWLRVLVLWVRR
jgi:hypothetical protein